MTLPARQQRRSVARSKPAVTPSVSLADLEAALKITAYCLLRIGPALAPILERLEREVERAKRDDPRERARRILDSYSSKLISAPSRQYAVAR